jgi:Alpha-kinase family
MITPKLSTKPFRDNLNSTDVKIDLTKVLGEGTYRITYRGTYTNGERVNQLAACKIFKDRTHELEWYEFDTKVIAKATEMAQNWNTEICSKGYECIQFTRGSLTIKNGVTYMFEPLIKPYYKYTSNSGWISTENRTSIQILEAFCHYTYHISGGTILVCDLQGLFKMNRFAFLKSRYLLTDPAICSQQRSYGPTDLGEKGIERFFTNHKCNKFCQKYGKGQWRRPRAPKNWFSENNSTDCCGHTRMMPLQDTELLSTHAKIYI